MYNVCQKFLFFLSEIVEYANLQVIQIYFMNKCSSIPNFNTR